ncbi:hypothetical protein NEMIN01_1528, partial [Nematocida minor]|uniref:uncharacterized protein n=1 Tax=Nematocida minor TaxID=1912983 RepID=UPI00221FC6FC
MNELNKLCSIKYVTNRIVKERAEIGEYYARRLVCEIEYSNKDEIWMILCVLKDKDKTAESTILKNIIQKSIENGKIVVSQYKVFLGVVEGLPSNEKLMGSLLSKLEEGIVAKETRKYLKSKDDASMQILSYLAQEVETSHAFYQSLLPFLPYYLSLQKIAAIRLVGNILSKLPPEEMERVVESCYKNEYLYSLSCAASLVFVVLQRGDIKSVSPVISYLLRRDIKSILNRLVKYRSFHLSLYVLAGGMLYCAGELDQKYIQEVEKLYCTDDCYAVSQCLEPVLRMSKGCNRETLCNLLISLVARGKQMNKWLVSALDLVEIENISQETAASVIKMMLCNRKDASISLVKKWIDGSKTQSIFSRIILSQTKLEEYFSLVDTEDLTEREKSIYHKQILRIIKTRPCSELRMLIGRLTMLDTRIKQKIVEEIKSRIISENTTKKERTCLMGLMIKVLESEEVPELLEVDIPREKRANIALYYEILKIQNRREEIRKEEILYKIKTETHFKKGMKLYYCGLQSFPDVFSTFYGEIYEELRKNILGRKVKMFKNAFRVLQYGIAHIKSGTSINYNEIFTDETVLWIYRTKELVASLNEFLKAIRVYSEKNPAQCRASIEYINRHSTVRYTIIQCSTILHNISLAQISSQTASTDSVSLDEKSIPKITDRVLSNIIATVSMHQDPNLLLPLVAGAASSVSFGM